MTSNNPADGSGDHRREREGSVSGSESSSMKYKPSLLDIGHVYWRPIILVMAIFLIDGLGYFVSAAAQTQLFEDIICRQTAQLHAGLAVQDADHDSNACKSPAVQAAVAQIFGLSTLFDGIPGLLLAVPYGALADKRGRRFVLALSMWGQAFGALFTLMICWTSAPIRMVWLSSLFSLIGGGSTVAQATCMMVVSDATTEAQRSRFFFYLQSSFIMAELIGPPLGASLLTRSVWLPLLLGLGASFFTAALALFVPDTLRPAKISPDDHANEEAEAFLQRETSGSDDLPKATKETWYQHIASLIQFIFSDRNVAILVATFLLADFGRQSLSVLLQYISERFDWTLARASLFTSFRGLAQLVCCLLVFPGIDYLLITKFKVSARNKDAGMAKASLILLSFSFFLLGIASNVQTIAAALVIYTLGSGFGTFARSLVSSLIAPNMIGTMYTTLSVADTTGSLLAGPLVAAAFGKGVELQGFWHGLPWLLSCLLCSVAAAIVFGLRFASSAQAESASGSEEEAPLNE